MSTPTYAPGIEINAPISAEFAAILTPEVAVVRIGLLVRDVRRGRLPVGRTRDDQPVEFLE